MNASSNTATILPNKSLVLGNHFPLVEFNELNGVLTVRSTDSNHTKDPSCPSGPTYVLIDDYLGKNEALTCNFYFDEFKIETTALLFGVFKTLKSIKEQGKNTTINWFTNEDNLEALEMGKDFSELYDLTININPSY